MTESRAESPASGLEEAKGGVPKFVGRYRVLFPIASGGMGTVYVASLQSERGVGRLLALKVLRSPSLQPEELQAFFNEARITARLSHPNIVSTLELGEVAGVPFIVMELIQGVSLRDALRRLSSDSRLLPPMLAAWIASRAAAGLHAAHELTDSSGRSLGLVHRDVSPDNILLGYDGSVRLTDFGIAKLSSTSERTREGVLKGKFAYMSPEQVSGEPLDRRSDIFSLGVVLWESIACRRLFRGKTPRETIAKILGGRLANPAHGRDDVPDALVAITMRCLAGRPQDRFQDCAELERALRGVIRSGQGVDDADLAQLLADDFKETRAGFEARLAACEQDVSDRAMAGSTGGGVSSDGLPAVHSQSSVALELEPAGRERERERGVRRRSIAAAVALFVVTVGAFALLQRVSRDETPSARLAVAALRPGVDRLRSPPSGTPRVDAETADTPTRRSGDAGMHDKAPSARPPPPPPRPRAGPATSTKPDGLLYENL